VCLSVHTSYVVEAKRRRTKETEAEALETREGFRTKEIQRSGGSFLPIPVLPQTVGLEQGLDL